MASNTHNCISDRVTTLIDKSIEMYNQTKPVRPIKKIKGNYSITDDTFKWNIGDDTTPENIEIIFKDIKGLCKDQIYLVDFLIHYAFSLVNECTYPQQNKSKTCDINGINLKIARMIKTLQEFIKKSNGSSPSK